MLFRSLAFAILLMLAVPLTSAQSLTLRVDPAQSTLAYTGSSVLHSWTGTSEEVTGRLVVDPENPAGAEITLSAPVASFDSGNRSRDSKMREVTEPERFPSVTFTVRRVRVDRWNEATGERSGQWTLTGDLAFHGVTRSVTVTADVTMRGGMLTASGSFPVSLTAHDVDRPRLVGIPIGDEITVRFDVRAVAG